jgi:thiosulfate/3-mercaptopyruvate sulfurtransferase
MNRLFLAAVLVLISTSSAFAFLGDGKFKAEVETEAVAVKLVRDVQKGGYELITTDELKAMLDSGTEVLVIDTMPYEESYKKEHVPGAKQFLFPIPDMLEWDSSLTDGKSVDDFTALLGPDKQRTMVIYCGFVKCTRSHNGALWAKKLGYEKVFRYTGGIFAWKGAGYEAAKVE